MNRSILLSLLFLTTAVSAQQQVPVSTGSKGQAQEILADPRPEPEWDLTGFSVAESGLAFIARSDDASDPARTAEVQTFAKSVFSQVIVDESGTILTTTGELGNALVTGELHAVEIDLFDELWDPTYDPTPEPAAGEMLGARVEIVEKGTGAHVAFLCFYDQAQYLARMASLGASERTVWCGDLVQTDGTGARSVYVSGSDNEFGGCVRSGGGMKIGGNGHAFADRVYWDGGLLQLNATGTTFAYTPARLTALQMAGCARSRAGYAALPDALVFSCNVTVLDDGAGGLVVSDGAQSWPAEGKVVVTSGTIDVEGLGLAGTITLVADGEINLSAGSSLLRPAADGLLAWTTGAVAGGLTLGGSANVLEGGLVASGGAVRFNGSDNRLAGKVRGTSVQFLGSGNELSDGIH